MHQLFESLLNLLSAFKGIPDLMRRSVDNVPTLQVLGQLRQVALLLLPCVAILDLLSGADDNKRGILVLDLTAGLRISSGEGAGHEALLQLSKDKLAILLS
ncbi:hypothetical protein HG530_012709 [Fusarium avenaceum]|nr:hypothetical protein HG530_012709 [Fusarium avenaceum]